ncbi:MAG: prepilin-type N-terminal cleavage/methylation domain-containing protein [Acidobacteria bacterium]|nr:prepilin-type N-terminal cleavage/methylation domain-containing protein [Acidobacteriota bacterium]
MQSKSNSLIAYRHVTSTQPLQQHRGRRSQRGSTLIELMINLAIISVLTATTLPSVSGFVATYKLQGAARMMAGELTLAKMRAAASFTQAQVTTDIGAGTFELQLYDKAAAVFVTEGGPQYLPQGMSFSYGAIETPAGTQTTIEQSTAIIFNSRGIPIDNTGAPTANYALYITNGSGMYFAITEAVNGTVYIWRYNGSGWVKTG